MTLGELERLSKSKTRVKKLELQEKASFDYILASLIGRAVIGGLDGKSNYPDISVVYPTLFEDREKTIQEQKTELSVARFKEFASAHNKKFKKEVSK